MTTVRVMDEKHAGEPDATGVLSPKSSATCLNDGPREDPTGVLSSDSSGTSVKDGPPNGGLEAWMQVFGAFFMYFNTWGNSTNPIFPDSRAGYFELTDFVLQELCQAMVAIRHGMKARSSARVVHFRSPRSVPYRAFSWCF